MSYAYADLKLGNGTDDWLALRTPEGIVTDPVSWGAPAGESAAPPPAGGSLALRPLDADNLYLGGASSAWAPSPGFYAGGAYGSPGARNPGRLAGVAITAGDGSSCVLDAAGQAWCWGLNSSGQLGVGSRARRTVATPMLQAGLRFVALAQAASTTCGAAAAGGLYCTGFEIQDWWRPPERTWNGTLTLAKRDSGTYAALTGGAWAFCGTRSDNQWRCLGHIGMDAYGDATLQSMLFIAIAPGWNHICGITTGRSVACKGWNLEGQLGMGTTAFSALLYMPTGSPVGDDYTAIAAGTASTCGLGRSGQAYCWGSGWAGQLGNGSTQNQSSYVRVQQPPGVVFSAITAFGSHACGLTPAGRACCWG